MEQLYEIQNKGKLYNNGERWRKMYNNLCNAPVVGSAIPNSKQFHKLIKWINEASYAILQFLLTNSIYVSTIANDYLETPTVANISELNQ